MNIDSIKEALGSMVVTVTLLSPIVFNAVGG